MTVSKNNDDTGQLQEDYNDLYQRFETLDRHTLLTNTILECAPIGYVLVDQDGSIQAINSTFTLIFGYSERECLNRSLSALFKKNDDACDFLEISDKLKNVQDVTVERTACMHKNGTPVYISIYAKLIVGQNEQAYSCYHITNISERVKAEDHASVLNEISHAINSTRNLNELYLSIHLSLDKLIDTTNFYIALYDKKTDQLKFVYYTDVAEEDGSEIEVIDNASKLKGSYTTRVVFGEKPVLLHEEQITEDFKSKHIPIGPISKNWLGVPLTIKDKVIGAVVVQSYSNPSLYTEKDIEILQSVTEQIAIAIETKRTEDELKESERLHKALFTQAADAIMVHDLGRRFLRVNEVAVKRFGYSEQELLQMTPYDIVLPEVAPTIEKSIAEIIDKGALTLELCHVTKNGTQIPSELNSKLIFYRGKQAIMSIARDLSERRKNEAKRKTLEQRLNRIHTEQVLGQLAGGVAHDLNNILSGISSYPDLLLRKISDDSPLRGPLETIKKSGFKAAKIVEDLLTMTRLGKKNNVIININKSLTDFLTTPEYVKIKKDYPSINVKVNFEEDLLNISGSDVHLSKIFLNLLKNGFEAISGQGKICIETENRYFSSRTENYDFIKEGEYVVIMVSDTGVGIRKEDIDSIFEPFYTTKIMGKSGTGLGMAIIWRTVKDHNGYILVDSKHGTGTTFTLLFPASREEIPDQKPILNLNEYMGNQELIYMVDDIHEQRLIASSILEELGYIVKTFKSGEDVLTYLKASHKFPDLFILDMIMEPGMDGAETFNRICQMKDSQKAIVASGFSQSTQIKGITEMGIGQYIRKPYTLENLAVAVKRELNEKQ